MLIVAKTADGTGYGTRDWGLIFKIKRIDEQQ
jgi:hypothetical protein